MKVTAEVIEDITAVIDQCFHPDYIFYVKVDGRGEMYLQGEYEEKDTVTLGIEKQFTRRWLLSPEMNESEIVQTVFKLVMTSMEHRAREWFKYQNQPVFCPHFDVEWLVKLCESGKFANRKKAGVKDVFFKEEK